MKSRKLTQEHLQKIVVEECKKVLIQLENESRVNPAEIKNVVVLAEKLLSAINSFKKDATEKLLGSLPHLDETKKVLEHMLETPGAYLPEIKPVVKKVSLRRVEEE